MVVLRVSCSNLSNSRWLKGSKAVVRDRILFILSKCIYIDIGLRATIHFICQHPPTFQSHTLLKHQKYTLENPFKLVCKRSPQYTHPEAKSEVD